MKLIRTEEAEGQVLCHDITRIIKGGSKGPVFKKGHVVRREDIPVLLSVGKDHLYVWEKDDSMLHEDEAAMVLYEIAANKLRSTGADFDKTELPSNLEASDISEGKIELRTVCDGLLKVDRERLLKVNSFGQMMIACRHGDTPVKKGDKVAGMRVIPLVIEKEKMERVKAECAGDVIFHVLPYREKDCAVITTGN